MLPYSIQVEYGFFIAEITGLMSMTLRREIAVFSHGFSFGPLYQATEKRTLNRQFSSLFFSSKFYYEVCVQ